MLKPRKYILNIEEAIKKTIPLKLLSPKKYFQFDHDKIKAWEGDGNMSFEWLKIKE